MLGHKTWKGVRMVSFKGIKDLCKANLSLRTAKNFKPFFFKATEQALYKGISV
jgi:hypothetical protein